MAKSLFGDQESFCNLEFYQSLEQFGGLWHYCTPGSLNVSINLSPLDYDFSVNNYALSAAETGVSIITDAHMANHTHGLLGCPLEKVFLFEEMYLYRAEKYLKSNGRSADLSSFRCEKPIEITDLSMMRNEIVYINRNGYVADSRYTPFSYPWTGGYIYFNPAAQKIDCESFVDMKYRDKRSISFRSSISAPAKYKVNKGVITQASYLAYELGQRMFNSAHQYFSMLSKNFEAFSESAKRLGDTIVVTDAEMFNIVSAIAKRDFGSSKIQLLTPDAKLDIAKTIHSKYNASNSQIQRILNLPLTLVNELFPLQAKR